MSKHDSVAEGNHQDFEDEIVEPGGREHDSNNIDHPQWDDPLPLTTQIDSEPYPLDAMPEIMAAAVQEVQSFTQAPKALVGSCALSALSLAAQAHADVKRAEKLEGPTGLFMLTIADSGERKSTCDSFFMKSIRQYEKDKAQAAEASINDYNASMESWRAKQSGIKESIRQLAKNGKDTSEQENDLNTLEHNQPEAPLVPRLIYGDATPEALKWALAHSWPSGGVISSEAGMVFGSHGMGKDSIMRNLATLNTLWDGAPISTERRSTESFTLHSARLTVALQIQEPALREFFDRSGELARGTGFCARTLISWPESTQGYRPFTDPPSDWPALTRFDQRITEILEQDVPFDNDKVLSPMMFALAPDTKQAWIRFHNEIEEELKAGGKFHDVRDVASKTADNAVRIATLFQLLEHGRDDCIVGLAAFEGAARLAAWHLHEARRFYGEMALPKERADAVGLDKWLLDRCRKQGTTIVSRRDVQRHVTPARLRKKPALDAALDELMAANRVQIFQDAKRKEIHINPALLT